MNDYWEDDDDYLGEFMIEEPDDLTMIVMPKLEIDTESMIENYVNLARKCKNKNELRNLFNHFYIHVADMVSLENDIRYLQDRAKEIEFNVEMFKEKFGS